MRIHPLLIAGVAALSTSLVAGQAPKPVAAAAKPTATQLETEALKREAAAAVDEMHVRTQQMVDQVFSFGELGFQEIETSKYLTGVLEQEGFTIARGVAGLPTAWTARWGSG